MNDVQRQILTQLPNTAGVYLFKTTGGVVLYVGKAKSIRDRVRQYFGGHDERPMVPRLVNATATVDFVATANEKDALLLECRLINEHTPRFNTLVRDNDSFPQIAVDPRAPWPKIKIVRKATADDGQIFGPYTSAAAARQTATYIQRKFQLRPCSDRTLKITKVPCSVYQMGRCCAPCVDAISPKDYAARVSSAMNLLAGRIKPLVTKLTTEMKLAAEKEDYEEAARLRDLLFAVQETVRRQTIIDTKRRDRDIWGIYREGQKGAVALVQVREGAMRQPIIIGLTDAVEPTGALLSTLINQTYAPPYRPPPVVLIPQLPEGFRALSSLLGERAGRKVALSIPTRGDGKVQLDLAMKNARLKYQAERDNDSRNVAATVALATAIGVKTPLHRIECFDNSNIQGDHAVAAMSVFVDGAPCRREYRRYTVKTVVGADDYATMYEIISRRVVRAEREGTLPDLIIVDGGRGQVSVAMAALADNNIKVPLIGIAKPKTERGRGERDAVDKLILPHAKTPLRLDPHHAGLRLAQYLRDEVHDTAIKYHRKKRSKATLSSPLDQITGIGPTKKRSLLRTMGSLKAIRNSDVATLSNIPGITPTLAQTILTTLQLTQT
jgi:excinuclease ABC subunit C